MRWKAHFIVSFFLAVLVVFLLDKYGISLSLAEAIVFVALVSVSSQLPDLDLLNSKISQIVEPLIIIAIAGTMYGLFGLSTLSIALTIAATIGVYYVYKKISGHHRGFFHSAFFGILVATPVYVYFGLLYSFAVLLGVIFHICEDFLADNFGIGK